MSPHQSTALHRKSVPSLKSIRSWHELKQQVLKSVRLLDPWFRQASVLLCIALVAHLSPAWGNERDPLQSEFLLLGSLENLLSFPTTQEALDECVASKDESCLQLYSRFRRAVQRLFDAGVETALKRTLTAVEAECRAAASPGSTPFSPWQSCRGAVTALYFFPSKAQDRAILAHLRTLNAAVLRNALVDSQGFTGDWVYNRPDPQRWIMFVESVPTLKGQGLNAVFSSPPKPHTGISLLDPRYKPAGSDR